MFQNICDEENKHGLFQEDGPTPNTACVQWLPNIFGRPLRVGNFGGQRLKKDKPQLNESVRRCLSAISR